jgi:hypothetical protein
MGRTCNICWRDKRHKKFCSESLKRGDHLKDLGLDDINMKMNLKETGVCPNVSVRWIALLICVQDIVIK